MCHNSQWITLFNASTTTVMENFLRSLDKVALDNYFDMRQGKAESILDYIFREEILTVALKKDTAIDLDEKIRGYWLVRTSNLTERKISGIKIITQGQTELAQVKSQTIVARKRAEVRDDLREAGDSARPPWWIR